MTVTSNIHINLPGWSNATYAIGARRNNSGNAYQCIVAGASTAPPTGTGSVISPGGVAQWKWLSTIEYTTLQAWADAIPATLTQPVVGLLWNDNIPTVTATAGVAILTLTGHTTSSTNTITLQPAPGEGFQAKYLAVPTTAFYYGAANGVAIECPATGFGGINYVQINDAWVVFQGLQFKDNNPGSGATIIGGQGNNFHMSQCIVEGQSQSGGASMIQLGNATGMSITNSLIVDHDATGGDASIGAQGATGVVIANNTFYQTPFVANKGCLDSGGNTTTASNKAVNNIFLNYDAVFFSSGGLPWTTNHNAYTNASFTFSNSTDTGGSVFGITPSTTFINATNDFHLITGSACLNVGLADTADIPAAIDIVGSSRPQGAGWDIGPHELLAGSVISRNFISPIAFASGINTASIPIPVTWQFGLLQSNQASALDWRSNLVQDRLLAAAMNSSLPGIENASAPNPFSTDFSGDFGAGFGTSTFLCNPRFSIEWSAGILTPISNANVPIEWATSVNRLAAFPSEANELRAISTGGISVDWSALAASGAGRVVAVPIEWGATPRSDMAGVSDWLLASRRDAQIPAEWRGLTGVTGIANFPLEWSGQTSADSAANAEFFRSVSKDDRFLPAWVSNVTTDRAAFFDTTLTAYRVVLAPVDWQGVSTTIDAILSLETSSAKAFDSVAPMEPESSLKLDGLNSVEPLNTVQFDNPSTAEYLRTSIGFSQFLLETNGVRTSGISVAFPLEWRNAMVADQTFGLTAQGSLLRDEAMGIETTFAYYADATLPAAWTLGIDSYVVNAVDWSHLTSALTQDAAFGLEFSTTISVDVVGSYQMTFRRKSWGSHLEPNIWERKHST